MKKSEEFNQGCNIIKGFCAKNNIEVPNFIITDKINHLGFYDFDYPNNIYINLKKCKKQNSKNHPMMIYENTIIGTLIHEFGHLLHYKHFPKLTKAFKKIKKEPLIHYRQMDIEEDIAESFRLFILHPKRMLYGRCERFNLIDKCTPVDSYTYKYDLYETYKPKNELVNVEAWESFLV